MTTSTKTTRTSSKVTQETMRPTASFDLSITPQKTFNTLSMNTACKEASKILRFRGTN